MKTLNFLLSAKTTLLADKLTAYLVEAGHVVQRITQPGIPVEQEKYDYLIEIDPLLEQYALPCITFDVPEVTNDLLTADIVLKKNQHLFSFSIGNVAFQNNDFDTLYSAIVEGFIDVTISLSREDETCWTAMHTVPNQFLFRQLILFERQLTALQAFYASCEPDKLFHIPPLLNEADKAEANYLQQVIEDVHLSDLELELCVLALLLLFNSRSHAVYQYDYCQNSQIFTKQVEASSSCSYIEMANRINNPVYAICQNKFFQFSPQPRQTADLVLIIHKTGSEPIVTEQYAIRIHYDAANQKLSVRYRSDLYFFHQTENYLRYFIKKLPAWRNINAAIQYFLYAELSLYKEQLHDWNQTGRAYPQGKTIHHLFEAQVKQHPQKLALICANAKLTYQELNTKADHLAQHLYAHLHLQPDDLIGLFLDRTEWMPVAMLAVLKSGAAYVPIDYKASDERIHYILRDTRVKAIITQTSQRSELQQLLNTVGLNIPIFDETVYSRPLPHSNEGTRSRAVNSNHLAYVIYTSGTTGHPKGVMIEHKSVVNLAFEQIRLFDLTVQDNSQQKHCLWYANYVFDAHVWELYSVLLSGNVMHLITDEIRMDRENLAGYIQQHAIDIATLTPSLLTKEQPFNLKTLVMAGEVPNREVIATYLAQGTTVINAYGPTENTVCSTVNFYRNADNPINIGKPIANVTCYVLDEQQNPLPAGTAGELYVGGAGVARGYLHSDKLTQTCFIPDTFTQSPVSKKLYKTGDLVRILPDGSFDYLGRRDHQIKVRGYRVELEEIEIVLSRYPTIQQSVVLPVAHHLQANTYQGLIGYYVAQQAIPQANLFAHLNQSLPDYMVPQFLVHLSKLPVTTNGKLDRQALPLPYANIQTAYLAKDSVEHQLSILFSSVLGLENNQCIGPDDDFFMLGGTSILAMQLVTAVNRALNVHIRSATIFANPTVKKLSRFLSLQEQAIDLVTKLNSTADKINLFMIHPGMSGTEVYLSLAKCLSTRYSCYGLDNYNLNHTIKVDDLHDLAELYLSFIDKTRQETGQTDQPYLLSGWSIGGLISLKIAHILEQRGCSHQIRAILFDTFLMDDKLTTVLDYDLPALRQFLSGRGHSEEHIQKIISNIDCENKIVLQSLNVGQLTQTKVLLFKAMKNYDIGILLNYTAETDAYLTGLPYNNLNMIVDPANLTVVRLHNVNHSHVCEEEEMIDNKFNEWCRLIM